MEPQASSHSTESAALQLWTIRDAMAEDADRASGGTNLGRVPGSRRAV